MVPWRSQALSRKSAWSHPRSSPGLRERAGLLRGTGPSGRASTRTRRAGLHRRQVVLSARSRQRPCRDGPEIELVRTVRSAWLSPRTTIPSWPCDLRPHLPRTRPALEHCPRGARDRSRDAGLSSSFKPLDRQLINCSSLLLQRSSQDIAFATRPPLPTRRCGRGLHGL